MGNLKFTPFSIKLNKMYIRVKALKKKRRKNKKRVFEENLKENVID